MSKIKKISKNYHSLTVENALKDLEHLLYQNYTATNVVLELIVGNGKIKKVIVEFLKSRQIEHYIPMANSGMIVVEL